MYKKIVLLYPLLSIIFVSATLSMEKNVSSKTITSYDVEVIPFYQLLPLNQSQFNQLQKQAENGDVIAELNIATRYLNGLNPDSNKNLTLAEQWFLKARKKGSLLAHTSLVEVAYDQKDYSKVVEYALSAAEKGLIDQFYNAGIGYKNLRKFKNARECFEKTINNCSNHNEKNNLAWVCDSSIKELALIYLYGRGVEKDIPKAMKMLKDIASRNHIEGNYFLALQYMYGNSVVKKDIPAAKKIFTKIETKSKLNTPVDRAFFLNSLTQLGLIHEFHESKTNLARAHEYYLKSYQGAGQFHLARLALAKKIDVDPADIKKFLANSIQSESNKLPAYIYATNLLLEGDTEQAIALFKKVADQKGLITPLINLQLGIAYSYGFGVDQDQTVAQNYFQEIINDSINCSRSLYLARGYLKLFGLGVKKDVKKGLALIEESESKEDDVYYRTEDLFPIVKKVREEYAANQEALLLQQDRSRVQKTSQQKQSVPVTETQSSLFDITPDDWNACFEVNDDSRVIAIDKIAKTFTIHDSKRNEHLIVHVAKQDKKNDLTHIGSLQYHKRIFDRQGLGKRKLKRNTKYNHSFAEMTDFVIQYVGDLVPFIKDGTDECSDQLVAIIERHDLLTGKKLTCKAEYTFGKSKDDIYVYHRLLRPIKMIEPALPPTNTPV